MNRYVGHAALLTVGILALSAMALAVDRHHPTSGKMPLETGQDAFAALAEIAAMLQDDPTTDWTKVDLSALREHLVDMNALTLEALVEEEGLDEGLAIIVKGSGRTLGAVQRMVPAHAKELNAMPIWSAIAEKTASGAKLIVTSSDPAIRTRIRALGFFGLMATGSHHQAHHLIIARGESVHHRHR